MAVSRVEDLVAFQRAVALRRGAHALVRQCTVQVDFKWRSQVFDAILSVESNIAEGWTRSRHGEMAQFLRYAHGSLDEAWRRPSQTENLPGNHARSVVARTPALRHLGTSAPRHSGTPAPRHSGTSALRTTALRHHEPSTTPTRAASTAGWRRADAPSGVPVAPRAAD